MTREEIENSYMFKVVRRALMNELPYIKDVRVSEELIGETKHLIFLDFDFDPFIFSKLHNIPLSNIFLRTLKHHTDSKTSVPEIFFNTNYRDKVSSIMRGIEKLVNDIQLSSVIPSEYKLNNKKLSPFYYHALMEYVPQDIQLSLKTSKD